MSVFGWGFCLKIFVLGYIWACSQNQKSHRKITIFIKLQMKNETENWSNHMNFWLGMNKNGDKRDLCGEYHSHVFIASLKTFVLSSFCMFSGLWSKGVCSGAGSVMVWLAWPNWFLKIFAWTIYVLKFRVWFDRLVFFVSRNSLFILNNNALWAVTVYSRNYILEALIDKFWCGLHPLLHLLNWYASCWD